MSNLNQNIEHIVNLVNQAHPKYTSKVQQLAWQKGMLIAVLAYAIQNDSDVAQCLRHVIDTHNEKFGGCK